AGPRRSRRGVFTRYGKGTGRGHYLVVERGDAKGAPPDGGATCSEEEISWWLSDTPRHADELVDADFSWVIQRSAPPVGASSLNLTVHALFGSSVLGARRHRCLAHVYYPSRTHSPTSPRIEAHRIPEEVIPAIRAHNACTELPFGMRSELFVRECRRNLQGNSGGPVQTSVDRDKRPACADIEDRAEIQESFALPVHPANKHGDRKRKTWGSAPFFHSCTFGPGCRRPNTALPFSHMWACGEIVLMGTERLASVRTGLPTAKAS